MATNDYTDGLKISDSVVEIESVDAGTIKFNDSAVVVNNLNQNGGEDYFPNPQSDLERIANDFHKISPIQKIELRGNIPYSPISDLIREEMYELVGVADVHESESYTEAYSRDGTRLKHARALVNLAYGYLNEDDALEKKILVNGVNFWSLAVIEQLMEYVHKKESETVADLQETFGTIEVRHDGDATHAIISPSNLYHEKTLSNGRKFTAGSILFHTPHIRVGTDIYMKGGSFIYESGLSILDKDFFNNNKQAILDVFKSHKMQEPEI